MVQRNRVPRQAAWGAVTTDRSVLLYRPLAARESVAAVLLRRSAGFRGRATTRFHSSWWPGARMRYDFGPARSDRGVKRRAFLCTAVAMASLAGCQRSDPPQPTIAEVRQAERRLAPVWELLARPDADTLREAARALADFPPQIHDNAVYTVEGDPALLDVLRIGDATVRVDGDWMQATARSFKSLVQSQQPDEARWAYEALDGLLAGVMRSARSWAGKRAGSNTVPLAHHSVLNLRALLARVMLESDATAGDPGLRDALKARRERLHAIGRDFSRISPEVP